MNFQWPTKKTMREVGLYILAAIVVFGVFYITKRLFAAEIPLTNRDALMLVIGNVMAWGTQVFQYFFGSSKGSADKTETMTDKKPE